MANAGRGDWRDQESTANAACASDRGLKRSELATTAYENSSGSCSISRWFRFNLEVNFLRRLYKVLEQSRAEPAFHVVRM